MKKISRLTSVLALGASLVAPLLVFADTPTGINKAYIDVYYNSIIDIINLYLVPLLIAVAFIVFLWGIYNYFILGGADEKKRTDGRTFTIYGIIGLAIITSVWGIVNIFTTTLNLPSGKAPPAPTINASGSAGSTKAKDGEDCWYDIDCANGYCDPDWLICS